MLVPVLMRIFVMDQLIIAIVHHLFIKSCYEDDCKLLNNSVPCVLLLILLGLNIGSCKVDQKQDVLRITVQKKLNHLIYHKAYPRVSLFY
jgi:hypothetical protein